MPLATKRGAQWLTAAETRLSGTGLSAMCASIAHVCTQWADQARGEQVRLSRNRAGKSSVDKRVSDTSRSCCKRLLDSGEMDVGAAGSASAARRLPVRGGRHGGSEWRTQAPVVGAPPG